MNICTGTAYSFSFEGLLFIGQDLGKLTLQLVYNHQVIVVNCANTEDLKRQYSEITKAWKHWDSERSAKTAMDNQTL